MKPTTEEFARKRLIAERLVATETAIPSSILLYPNTSFIPVALQPLLELGFRKPFLTSAKRFVIDCFLTYPAACDLLLGHCFLLNHDEQHRWHIWNGYGTYKDCVRILPRFEGDEPILFAINLEPVFPLFADVLERSPTLEAEMRERAEAEVREYLTQHPPAKIPIGTSPDEEQKPPESVTAQSQLRHESCQENPTPKSVPITASVEQLSPTPTSSIPDADIARVLDCKCGQKVRVPAFAGKLRVSCPNCKEEWETIT